MYFFFRHTYIAPIVPCAIISEELKHKCQEILARQSKNAAAKEEKIQKKRSHKVKTLAAEREQHQVE